MGRKQKEKEGGGRGEIKSFEEDVERWLCYQWSCLRTTENAKATCVSWRVQDAHGWIHTSFFSKARIGESPRKLLCREDNLRAGEGCFGSCAEFAIKVQFVR